MAYRRYGFSRQSKAEKVRKTWSGGLGERADVGWVAGVLPIKHQVLGDQGPGNVPAASVPRLSVLVFLAYQQKLIPELQSKSSR